MFLKMSFPNFILQVTVPFEKNLEDLQANELTDVDRHGCKLSSSSSMF